MNKNQGREVYAAIAKSNLTKGIKMIKISRDIVRNKKTSKCRWREKKVALFRAYSKRRRRSAISIKRSRSGTEKR